MAFWCNPIWIGFGWAQDSLVNDSEPGDIFILPRRRSYAGAEVVETQRGPVDADGMIQGRVSEDVTSSLLPSNAKSGIK